MMTKLGFLWLPLMLSALNGVNAELRRKQKFMLDVDELVDEHKENVFRGLAVEENSVKKAGKKSGKKSSKKSSKKMFSGTEVMEENWYQLMAELDVFVSMEMSMSMAPTISPMPTSMPTPTALSFCDTFNGTRKEAFETALVQITEGPILNNPATPQGAAFRWLMDDDPLQTDPCEYLTVIQRYVLATLYFSTFGNSWFVNTDWMTNSTECDWYGITCSPVKVTRISLRQNNLNGEIPPEVTSLPLLESLRLRDNMMVGTIPALNALTSLVTLDVENNELSGDAFIDFAGLSNLERYRVSGNKLAGTIPADLSSLESIRQFWFADNAVTGTLPDSLFGLSTLETLYFYRNAITGSLPDSITLSSLKGIQAYTNFLAGTIPEGFYDSTLLEEIRLDQNALGGTISESIGDLTALTDLRLSSNLLGGPLPISFYALSNLEILRIESNQFTGVIRDSFDTWNSTYFVDIRENSFMGSLPSSIFDIPVLTFFYASNNTFDSTIPANWGSSMVLEDFYVDGNDLTGTLPIVQPGQLLLLEELLIQNNELTGTVPPSVCALETTLDIGSLRTIYADCGATADPKIECDCCHLCFPLVDGEQTNLGIDLP